MIGLIEKERWFDCQKAMLVYPEFEEIMYIPLKSRYEQGGTTLAQQFQRDTTLVAGVRQYQPGDRFSWIDWKATARTNEIMSKEFEIRQSNDLLIVLDCEASRNFEELVKFAASAIRAILRNGGQTGLLLAGEERTFVPIRGGEQHQQQLFYHLAKVKPDSAIRLSDLLEGENAFFQQPATMIVITSVLSKDLIESSGLYLRRIAPLIIYLIKKKEETLTREESVLIADALHRGIVLKTLHETEYQRAFSEVKFA